MRGLAFWRALSNDPGVTLPSQEKIESVHHSFKRHAASAAERQGGLPLCLLIIGSFAPQGSCLCRVLLEGVRNDHPAPLLPRGETSFVIASPCASSHLVDRRDQEADS